MPSTASWPAERTLPSPAKEGMTAGSPTLFDKSESRWFGAIVAAGFIVAVGDLSTFAGPDNLAVYAGRAPVAHDSGRRVGNLRWPARCHRTLRYMYGAPGSAAGSSPSNKTDRYPNILEPAGPRARITWPGPAIRGPLSVTGVASRHGWSSVAREVAIRRSNFLGLWLSLLSCTVCRCESLRSFCLGSL